jgi:alkanesulfonate monooxygenase SsuD/methylene tetrahydromethanopterin reductase-like flavin-dependent oxidoreductase (luciferase family)
VRGPGGLAAADDVVVPAQDGVRGDQQPQSVAACFRYHAEQGREHGPVRPVQLRAAVTGGAGNSNALVGTPETVAQAILDYIDLGVDIISMRGYDLLADAIDIGQQVIPIVREEVAKRDAAAAVVA